MKIGFGDFCDWDFNPQSPEFMPLGGSQSAACYLAQSLAQQGHEVFFLTGTNNPGRFAGVTCLSWSQTPQFVLRGLQLDVFICLLGSSSGPVMRPMLGAQTRLVLWTQHRVDQQAMAGLTQPQERQAFDAFLFASEWQRAEYLAYFGLPAEKTSVLPNAVAPAFLDLFPAGQPILPSKAQPPVLAGC